MNKENIILFGASRLGEIAFNVLKDRCNICYYSDNDKSKWNKLFCGIKIIAPDELVKFSDNKIVIASMYYGEICVQLKNMGLDNIYIFSYVDSNDRTYRKRYSIDKMCDLDIYNNLKIDAEFKKKFLDNFSLIYGKDEENTYSGLEKSHRDKKNVLIIAYYFPPIGGGGVQRTLKYVKYLKEFGWNPIVVTVGEDYCFGEKDFSLLDEIPQDIEVLRINHLYTNTEQLNHEVSQQILNLIYGLVDDQETIKLYVSKIKEDECSRRNRIFEPDIYISWANSVLLDIEKIVDFNKIDLIFTTSSPYSDHIVGYYIKKKYGIRWVVDFRDEWTNHHYANETYCGDAFRVKLHRFMEQKIVDFADRVITVTSISSQNYRDLFNLPYDKVITITNGYDEEDFKQVINDSSKSDKFDILFYGSLYLSNSCLDNVILAINQLIEEKLIDKNSTKIRLIGQIDSDILNLFKKVDKYNIVIHEGYKPHIECINEARKSNLLLLPIGRTEAFIRVYSGKVFEYIRLLIPILSISPKGSLVEELLSETKCGENFEYDDFSGIKSYILKLYNMWLLGKKDFDVNETRVKEFERKRLTEKLSEVFNDLLKEDK